MAGKTSCRRGAAGRGTPVLGLGLVAAALAFSMASAGLSVTISSPADGTWTAAGSVTVTGAASGAGSDSRFLDSDADLSGGLETNTTVAGGSVRQAFPANESFRYQQAFTGLGGSPAVDPHWTWDFSGSSWEVSSDGTLSAAPPALAHSGTSTESVTWMAALPGNATEGWVAFRYLCQANAFMNVYASPTGHASGEATILSTGSAGGTDFWHDLSSQAAGADMFVVRFEAGASGATSSYCAVDDFVAEFNFTRAAEHTLRLADDFSDNESALWSAPQGGWDATSLLSPSPPAFGHSGTAGTSARLNLAFPNPITRATLAFRYQCEANASVSAMLSGTRGAGETTILSGLPGAPLTSFAFDATPLLAGNMSLFLRLSGASLAPAGDLCIIDDLAVNVTFRGHLGLTYEGSYLSPIVNLGIAADLAGFGWWGGAGANTTLDIYARTSLLNDTYTAWVAVPAGGGAPSEPQGRYVQFRADFTSAGGFETAVVDAFIANFSAIVSVEWTTNMVSWYLATGTSNWTADVPLGNGANTISVRARDTTGGIVTSQVQVSRDNIPPGPAGKPQAPAVTNGTAVTWTWGPASDVGVGVDHYLVDVGLSAGGTELASGVQVSGTSHTFDPVPDGVTVYLSVRSVDRGGLAGMDRVTSNGTVVDRTAPAATSVLGSGAFSNADSLTWTWSRPSDPGTGVSVYRVSVGTTAGASDAFSGEVAATSYTLSSPVSGTTYFATVVAVDGASNEGPPATSAGTTSDRDAPTGPVSVTTASTLTNASAITWQWSAAADAISGVSHYRVEVGSGFGLRDLADITVTDLTYTLGFVESGTFVYLGVTPVDGAGNEGARVAAPMVHTDSTAPGNTTIGRIDPFVSNASVDIEWSAVTDAPAAGASGVSHFVVRVRQGGSTTESTVTQPGYTLQVADGATYTVEVFAVDEAQNRGPVASVTFTGDQSGPAAPAAVTARVSNPLGPSFTASWNATVDAGVGLKEYRVSVGTMPGGSDIASGVRVTRLNYTWTGHEGTQYWVTVRAVDKLDNAGPPTQTAEPASYTPTGGGGGFLPGADSALALAAIAGAAAAAGLTRRAVARAPGGRRGMP